MWRELQHQYMSCTENPNHEDRVEKEYMTKRRSLKSDIQGWYMIVNTLGKEFDTLMKTTCLGRQTHSNQMMESWLATMKEKYDYLGQIGGQGGVVVEEEGGRERIAWIGVFNWYIWNRIEFERYCNKMPPKLSV